MSVRWLAFGVLAILPRVLSAQGVTSAAIEGTVTAEYGAPIEGATVRIINDATGRRWQLVTRHARVDSSSRTLPSADRIASRSAHWGSLQK